MNPSEKSIQASEFTATHSLDAVEKLRERHSRIVETINAISEQKKHLSLQIDNLKVGVQAHDKLQDAYDQLDTDVKTAEAKALVAGETVNLDSQLATLRLLGKDLKNSKRTAEARRTAIRMAESDRRKLDALIPELKENRQRILQEWLHIRRDLACHHLKMALQDMGPLLADLLAIEDMGHFRIDYGMKFFNLIDDSKIEYSGIKPAWVASSVASRFPGFQEAVEALRAELAGGA